MEKFKLPVSDLAARQEMSAIRINAERHAKRTDGVKALNVAIGNITERPMPSEMTERYDNPSSGGYCPYTPTDGELVGGINEVKKALLRPIQALGFSIEGLSALPLTAGSQGLLIAPLAAAGKTDGRKKPIMVINPVYTNTLTIVDQFLEIPLIAINRVLQEDGIFSLPDLNLVEDMFKKYKPAAIMPVNPDNPGGVVYFLQWLIDLAVLCVKYGVRLIFDEAYRGLQYDDQPISSVWALVEKLVPGIIGHRTSLETASKIFNACGSRMGGIVSDDPYFVQQSKALASAFLCPPRHSQYVFGAVAHMSDERILEWYDEQNGYYGPMLSKMRKTMIDLVPELIIPEPTGALYLTVDGKKLHPKFNAEEFSAWSASEGSYKGHTTFGAPMRAFYIGYKPEENPGAKQIRLAAVLKEEDMYLSAEVFAHLFKTYISKL